MIPILTTSQADLSHVGLCWPLRMSRGSERHGGGRLRSYRKILERLEIKSQTVNAREAAFISNVHTDA